MRRRFQEFCLARQSDPKGFKVGGVFVRDIVMTIKQVLRCKMLGTERFLEELSEHYVRTMLEHGGNPRLVWQRVR